MKKVDLIANTAMLAGELLVKAGADIYRVEDTMNRILRHAGVKDPNVIVLPTALNFTMNIYDSTTTHAKRIRDKSINLNHIYMVNDISRELCSGQIGLKVAYRKLCAVNEDKPQYSDLLKYAIYSIIALCFVVLFNGSSYDCLAAFASGIALVLALWACTKLGFNSICINAAVALAVVLTANLMQYIMPYINIDKVIIGGIIPLVPGVKFTTAVKDTLNGDYISGMSRMLEAIVLALAIAAGAGAAMAGAAMAGGIL